jgi:predicted nucleic acid-binding protein
MSADFLDTNILVYAYDDAVPDKQRVARGLLRLAVREGMIVSAQVLAEFASTLFHKMSPRASAEQVDLALHSFESIRVMATDADIVRRAVEARGKYGIHFYDGMIVAAAERAGCKRIWSEDLNPGQRYFGIVVENPFG